MAGIRLKVDLQQNKSTHLSVYNSKLQEEVVF